MPRRLLLQLLWLLGLCAFAAGPLGCSGDEDPTSSSTPAVPLETAYQRRLTGTEAAEITRQFLRDKAVVLGISTENVAGIVCNAEDFNERDRAWLVRCFNPKLVNVTFRVYDMTRLVEQVR